MQTHNQPAKIKSSSSASTTKTSRKEKPGASAPETMNWRERRELAAAEKKKQQELEAQRAAKELQARQKADAIAERKRAAAEKLEQAREKKLAEARSREEERARIQAEKEMAEQLRLKQEALAAKQKATEDARLAKIAAREKAQEEKAARRRVLQEAKEARRSREVYATRSGGGLFSRGNRKTSSEYMSQGHHIYVNQGLLDVLDPSNARIEISLSEQKARVYRASGGQRDLVIETSVSTGKPGHTTPTGTYRIQEKQVEKRSSLYGSWLNSSGQPIEGSSDVRRRPRGATTFVGADMPYWMRITGGIGMHIGYVPEHPASHGCIRVPETVQPLIYSKVGVGTQVSITR